VSPRAPRPRRQRGALESLLSIVLVLESLVVFFLALAVFGLDLLDPVPALVGGGAILVVTLLLSRVQNRAWGRALAWVLQAVLIALGVLVPLMYVIGTGFAALFVYCFVTGRRLDRRNGLAA